MAFTNTGLYPYILTPFSNIIPLAYIDGQTYAEQVERLRSWMNETLVPDINNGMANALEELQNGLAFAESHYDQIIADAYAYVTGVSTVQAPVPGGGDDTAALQGFITALPGKTIIFRAGRTYKLTDTITVPSGTKLDFNGAVIDCTGFPVAAAFRERPAFLSAGTTETSKAVADPAGAGTYTVTGLANVTGLAGGDLTVMYNTEAPVPGMTRTDRKKGELRIVKSVDTGLNSVTFETGTVHGYTAAGLGLMRVNPVLDVEFRNGTILMGGTGTRHNGIRVEYGRNPVVDNMTIIGAAQAGIDFSAVINGAVRNSRVKDSDDELVGYGIVFMDGTVHSVIENNYLRNCKHLIAGGGRWPTTHIDVRGNRGIGRPGYPAYDCHESTFYWNWTKNTARDCGIGFLIRGQHITVEGNEVTNSSQQAYKADTWDHVTEQRGIRFINNTAHNATFGGIWLDGIPDSNWTDPGYTTDPNGAYKDVNGPSLKINAEISGNALFACGTNPVLVRHFQNVTVTANTLDCGAVGSHGIYCVGLSTGQSNGAVLTGNTVRFAGADGIRTELVDNVTVTGGFITGPVQHGVEVLTCNRTNAAGVVVRNPGRYGVWVNGGAVHTLTGCTVSGGLDVTYDAVRVSSANDVSVSGGYLGSARKSVLMTGGDRHLVTGVNGTGAPDATPISSDATNKVIANNL